MKDTSRPWHQRTYREARKVQAGDFVRLVEPWRTAVKNTGIAKVVSAPRKGSLAVRWVTGPWADPGRVGVRRDQIRLCTPEEVAEELAALQLDQGASL